VARVPGFAASHWLEAACGQGLPIIFLAHEERAQQARGGAARAFTVGVPVHQVEVRRMAESAMQPGGPGRRRSPAASHS
jgi:hypothetical protein